MLLSLGLIISVVLQFIAAFWALRLIKHTGWRLSWIMISIGFLLMAIRRIIEINPVLGGKSPEFIIFLDSSIGIIISVLVVIGVILMKEIFVSLKRTEKSLIESEKRYNTLFNSNTDCIYAIDFDSNFIEVNQVICDVLGYSREELLKMNVKEIKSDKFAETADKLLEEVKQRGEFIFESEHLTKAGKIIPVEINSRIIDYDYKKIILSMARDITERKQIERKILQAVIETEEKDKERFAKDLHDGLGSLLSSIKLYLSMLKSDEVTKDEEGKMMECLKELVDEAMIETKEIANNLRPNIISRFGLVASLKSFCDKINQTGLLRIDFKPDITGDIDKEIELTLYRVIKELVNNTLKHASASSVHIDISYKNKMLFLKYHDNGVGFNVKQVLYDSKKSMGLSNIISRIKAVNGICDISSTKEKGMSVFIKIIS